MLSRSAPLFARGAGLVNGWPGNTSRFVAVAASIVWAVIVAGYGIGFVSVVSGSQPRGTVVLDVLFFLVVLVLPLLLIWLAAWIGEELQRQRQLIAALSGQIEPLAGALEETRKAIETGPILTQEDLVRALDTRGPQAGLPNEIAVAMADMAAGQKQMRDALEGLMGSVPAEQPQAAPAPAPVLAPEPVEPARSESPAPPPVSEPKPEPAGLPLLPDEEEPQKPDWPDLVRALDFPKDAQDFEGFRALQTVLKYRPLAQMLQSAEDVLTLLSQEGVYMDDLPIEMGSADDWRRFMNGQRGPSVGSVFGVRDDNAMELTRSLLKSDTIFRDTALFFQRRFDRVLSEFAKDASDERILELADTRSGRAYMMMTKLNGTFD